jgi:hypothetical protein
MQQYKYILRLPKLEGSQVSESCFYFDRFRPCGRANGVLFNIRHVLWNINFTGFLILIKSTTTESQLRIHDKRIIRVQRRMMLLELFRDVDNQHFSHLVSLLVLVRKQKGIGKFILSCLAGEFSHPLQSQDVS